MFHLGVQREKESPVFKKIWRHKALGKSRDYFKDLLPIPNAPL